MTDKKEEYHSGGAKVFKNNTDKVGVRDQTGLYANMEQGNAKPSAQGVFTTLLNICCCNTKVTVDLPMHSGWNPLQVRFGIHVREMEPCSK